MDKNQLLNHGETVNVSGNHKFLLKDSGDMWFVLEGVAEVFLVDIEDGESAGRRKHLFTISEGETLFPFLKDADTGLFVSGQIGTKLLRIKRDEWARLLHDPTFSDDFMTLLNNWLHMLSRTLAGSGFPKNSLSVEESGDASFAKQDIITTHEEVLWVKHTDGQSLYMGREDFLLSSDSRYMPLTSGIWLKMMENGTFSVKTSKELILQEDWQSALETFYERLSDFFIKERKKAQSQEQERLHEKTRKDQDRLRQSFLDMATIFQSQKQSLPPANADDPLLFAVQAIGNHLKVSVEIPMHLKKDDKDQYLKQITKANNLRMRKVMLEGKWWEKDQGSLLAFFEEEETPIALLPINAHKYVWIDPKTRERQAVTAEMAEKLQLQAYSFYPPFPNKKLNVFDLLKFGGRQAWKSDIVMTVALGIAAGLLSMLTPILTGLLYNDIIPQSLNNQLFYMGLVLLVSAVSIFLFSSAQSIAMIRVEGKMDASVQAAVWDRVLSLPVRFFRKYIAGDLSDRALGISSIRKILSGVTLTTILSSTFSLFNIILLFVYDATMAFVAFGLIIFALVVTVALGFVQLKQNAELMELRGRLTGLLFQLIHGISKFRVAGAESRAFNLWVNPFIQQRKRSVFVQKVQNVLEVFNSGFPIVSSMVLFFMVLGFSNMGTGTFLAFNSAYVSASAAILSLSTSILSSLQVIPLYKRAQPILNTLPEYDDQKTEVGELDGEIEINRVFFKYHTDSPYILQDVSLQANPGEFVAIVGSSGSGKSTLFRLLLGFDTPESGAVYYDGRDLSEVDVRSVRENLGVVLQNDFMMAGSIFENIIGSANLTLDDAWEAARNAGLEEDIKEMPMGMHTMLSEGAGTLSGGQRQRLIIARAIVRKPSILLFDEATSALDNKTQTLVSESLEKLRATRIVIAHRLSTIVNADRIYVMDHGKIVESDSYEALMQQNGLFAELAKRQLA